MTIPLKVLRRALACLAVFALGCACVPAALALELRVAPKALERTLQRELFNAPDGRYYLRGDRNAACFVYIDQPSVAFKDDRIVVHVHTHSRLGAGVLGRCVGLAFETEADVSVLPDAENESIGFRDARIDRLTGNRELDFFVIPFLSRKLPAKMRLDAADVLRESLKRSHDTTGYQVALDSLKVHSMVVEKNVMTVDLDGALSIQ